MTSRYFVSACILAGGLLLKFGAPLPAVVAGIGVAALWKWKAGRASRAGAANKS
jgi:hypothetical protein